MQQSVAQRVGVVRVADAGVPVGDRELAGDEDGGAFTAFLDDLHEVRSFGVFERCQQPIVDGQQVELGQSRQQARVGAIDANAGLSA